MNLIDRYVNEVGKRLPRNEGQDVEVELRSLLVDMVEDRAGVPVEKADEEIVVDVLLEMGPPAKVADSYRTRQQVLIGPELFPTFKLVVTIVIAIQFGIILVGLLLSVRTSDNFLMEFAVSLVRAVGGFIQSFVYSFSLVVLIFAAIERFLPEKDWQEMQKDLVDGHETDWHPRDLAEVTQENSINRTSTVIELVFTVFFFLLLNFQPHSAGIFFFSEESSQVVPILSANFYENLLPWLNVLMVYAMLLSGYKLYVRRKTDLVWWGEFVEMFLSAAVFYSIAVNGPVFGIEPDLLAMQGLTPTDSIVQGVEQLVDLLNRLANAVTRGIVIFELASAAKMVYDKVRLRSSNGDVRQVESKSR